MSDKEQIEFYRYFLKDHVRLTIDFSQTDQTRRVPPPPLEKPYPDESRRIDLVPVREVRDQFPIDLATAIQNRRSRRTFRRDALSQEELSFLLWSTAGIQRRLDQGTAFRTVPSAGARHAFETYLALLRVEGVEPGIYRYLPIEHQLLSVGQVEHLSEELTQASFGQSFIGKAAAVFIWAALPYRMEWRYDVAAHRVMLMDVGHICQNLYLACEAIGGGTCAIGAYHQTLMDRLIGVDGEDEFVTYLAPVGKI